MIKTILINASIESFTCTCYVNMYAYPFISFVPYYTAPL